jgi:hypothetical protein
LHFGNDATNFRLRTLVPAALYTGDGAAAFDLREK